jgi:hypothetical protein
MLSCRPECNLFGADLTYSPLASGGLQTDQTQAHIRMVCTHPVIICQECVVIDGPTRASVLDFEPIAQHHSAYDIQVGWEEGYRGPVRVDLESARCVPDWHWVR